MTREDILSIGKSVVVAIIVWLSGYVTGYDKGIEIDKDYIFEEVTKQAVRTARETLEIAKKLQKENDLLKEQQLNQQQNQKQ